MYKRNLGFTLIELLVVIAIIGILSSVVLSSLNTARGKARDGKRIAELKSLQIALELYYEANGTYPETKDLLVTSNYVSSLPVDPLNTGSHVYSYTAVDTDGTASTCETYYLAVSLEGGNTVLDADSDEATLPVTEDLCVDGGSPGNTDTFLSGDDDDPTYGFQVQPY